jgi:hypothetical protein
MPAAMPRWSNPAHPEAIACQECLYQAAKAFHKNKDVPSHYDPSAYPPPFKAPASPSGELT